MNRNTMKRWLLPALLTSAVLTAPLAVAGHHGDGHRGKPPGDICERLESGEPHADRSEMRERMEQRHAETAERLQLTEQQREIWDEIQAERQAEWQERMEERHERMREHCEQQDDG